MSSNYETSKLGLGRLESDSFNNSSSSNSEINVSHATVRTTDTPFGKLRVVSDLERTEIIFLILATLSILGTIAMTIYRLVDVIDETDSTFALVLLVNAAFCLIYVFHGVFGERPYELWAFMGATILVTLYCSIEMAVTSHRTTVKVIRLSGVLAFAPIVLALSLKISMQHFTSKNLIIRTLRSANIKFQNMCVCMFVFQTLLKFDFQTGISLFVFVLSSGVEHVNTEEIVILAVGIVLEIVWLIVGHLLPKYEKPLLVYCFLALSIPQPIYVMYKIVKTGLNWDSRSNALKGSIIACVHIVTVRFTIAVGYLFTTAALFLVTRCLVSYYLWIVVHNFGKGLREAVYFPEEKNQEEPGVEVDSGSPSPKQDEEADDYLGENVNYDGH